MKHRTLSLAGLLGLLALSAAAQAHEEQTAQPQQQPQQQADQMVVARDAETGQLRAATAQELATLQAAKLRASPSSVTVGGALKPQIKRHANGAVGARATDEMASYAVIGRRADGTLAEACFDSKGAADEAMKNGAGPRNQQATEK